MQHATNKKTRKNYKAQRLVRRLDLERALQQVEPHPSPKASLEQYTLPVDVAAEWLFIAAYINDDIINKAVVDLGCGTGILALGAVFLGAKKAIGVDIDKAAVGIAEKNAEKLGIEKKVQWFTGDIGSLTGGFDTVLQNPPFGVQKRGADRKFLSKALELAPVVYSLHKSGEGNRAFIKRFIEQHGGEVTGIFPMKLNIPKLFKFHTKRKYMVEVDLYRIVRK
jgi:putative methylase